MLKLQIIFWFSIFKGPPFGFCLRFPFPMPLDIESLTNSFLVDSWGNPNLIVLFFCNIIASLNTIKYMRAIRHRTGISLSIPFLPYLILRHIFCNFFRRVNNESCQVGKSRNLTCLLDWNLKRLGSKHYAGTEFIQFYFILSKNMEIYFLIEQSLLSSRTFSSQLSHPILISIFGSSSS